MPKPRRAPPSAAPSPDPPTVPRLRLHGGLAANPDGSTSQVPPWRYSLAQFLRVAQWARAYPEGVLELEGMFPPIELTGRQWRAWCLSCLLAKINREQPRRGRKWQQDWWTDTQRVARALNTPRLVIHWLPREWRLRFAHRLSAQGEDC